MQGHAALEHPLIQHEAAVVDRHARVERAKLRAVVGDERPVLLPLPEREEHRRDLFGDETIPLLLLLLLLRARARAERERRTGRASRSISVSVAFAIEFVACSEVKKERPNEIMNRCMILSLIHI